MYLVDQIYGILSKRYCATKKIFVVKEIMEEGEEWVEMDKKEILGQGKKARPILVAQLE